PALEATDTRYDSAGNIVSFTTGSVVSTFSYDTLGRLVASSDPDIGARTMSWDDAGRLIDQANGAGQHTSFGYDAAGRIVDERFGNGVLGHTDRDILGQPSGQRFTTGAGVALYNASATRTPFGALATIADSDGVGLDHGGSFTYDGGGRLLHATVG